MNGCARPSYAMAESALVADDHGDESLWRDLGKNRTLDW